MVFYTTTIPGAMSVTVFLSLIIFVISILIKSLRINSFKSIIRFDYLILVLFTLSGFINDIFPPRKEGGFVSWGLAPSVFLLFSLGIFAIVKLSKKLGRVYIFYVLLFLVIESLIGIGFKLYVAKYQLDPRINNKIDIQKDLLSLPYNLRFDNFAAHLQNYQLKKDNNLVFIYDKFADIQPIFFAIVGGGWILLISFLIRKFNAFLKEPE